MYTGNLIDELIATVERAEAASRVETEPESKSDAWFTFAPELLALEVVPQLAGVA